jgi:hypothetical protein
MRRDHADGRAQDMAGIVKRAGHLAADIHRAPVGIGVKVGQRLLGVRQRVKAAASSLWSSARGWLQRSARAGLFQQFDSFAS